MKIIIGIPRKVPLILGNPYRWGVSGNSKSAEDLVGFVLRNSCGYERRGFWFECMGFSTCGFSVEA